MYHNLPSLSALRSFEAAARHESFKAAAEELFVTATAVGSQVKHLEMHLDCVLFERQHRRVILTNAGQRLQAACQEAFSKLLDTTMSLQGHIEPTVVGLGVGPLFASEWLTPRLSRFWEQNPTLGLRLYHTSAGLRQNHAPAVADFARNNIDAMVVWGDGGWHDMEADCLLRVKVAPVASPTLLEKLGTPREPADLLKFPILHEADEIAWKTWFACHGFTLNQQLPSQVRIIQDGNVVQQAAMDGQGIALGIVPFVEDKIAAGRLVRVFSSDYSIEKAYYLAYPKGALSHWPLRALRDWLIAERGPEEAE